MKFFFGMLFGALLMGLYAYRQTISDVIAGRRALGAGAKTVSGVEQAIGGIKDLIGELDKS